MAASILVIEDNGNVLSLLQEVFESEGYDVDIAGDGITALQKIEQQYTRYDAILLDLVLPDVDGRYIIEYLRKYEERWADVLIVHSGDLEALRRMHAWGVRHYLSKPFDLDTLLALVSQLLSRNSCLAH